ncbi:YrhK-like protein [Alkalibacterium putridalgicola]|uniref:YrhK-like protein n=1 Tax=Alkalibacterium putridalgicola TaxID=426703 RepID=A0A1H7RYX6_9LACT|nr:YrhK family protein [Alkalibacterium putridalgicola]GEK88338.1 hypothetical protein APU01nite_03770 [Alkalibacterium putridalgicola]SEL65480.1 YrhK-like protein [Alkalibacterium putridalgicola]
MLPKKPIKPEKPQVEKKEHKLDPGKDEDIVVKAGGYRVYFQNYYTIVSLANDLLTGGLYLAGSLVQTFTEMSRLGMYLYIFASFFLLMRPILKIIQYVYLYDKNEYEEKVLGGPEEKFEPRKELTSLYKDSNDGEKKEKTDTKVEAYSDDDDSKEKKE